MRLKIPQIKILEIFLSLKFISVLVVIIFVTALGFLGWFLYRDFYQTITQSKEIIVLRTEVSPHSVNLEQFNTALEALENKVNPQKDINWQEIKNPFGFVSGNKPVTIGVD